jgi:hypothetical protein
VLETAAYRDETITCHRLREDSKSPSSHVPRSSVLVTVNSAIDDPHKAVERDREGEMVRYGWSR